MGEIYLSGIHKMKVYVYLYVSMYSVLYGEETLEALHAVTIDP